MHCAKSKCIHPTRPVAQACADCPRKAKKAMQKLSAVTLETVVCAKSKCVHPGRPAGQVRPDRAPAAPPPQIAAGAPRAPIGAWSLSSLSAPAPLSAEVPGLPAQVMRAKKTRGLLGGRGVEGAAP